MNAQKTIELYILIGQTVQYVNCISVKLLWRETDRHRHMQGAESSWVCLEYRAGWRGAGPGQWALAPKGLLGCGPEDSSHGRIFNR